MLLKEMNHRVKNAFTVVNGIVRMSAKYAKPENLVRDIQARFAALARAHDLTRPGLLAVESKKNPATFRALIDAILAPYLDANPAEHSKRLSVIGPDLRIKQESVTGLALMIYELATNAVKCGSLSLPGGSVHINLSVLNGQFELKWEERGGPKLADTPDHEGFGTNLLRRIVADQFAGEIHYDWNVHGLIVQIMAPANFVHSMDEPIVSTSSPSHE
jgi:two-component sensor histidine kinase